MSTRIAWALSLTIALLGGVVLVVLLTDGEDPGYQAASPGGESSPSGEIRNGDAAGTAPGTSNLPPDLSLEGQARDSDTGKPLPFARIVVAFEQGPHSETRRVKTDGEGRFSLRGVPPGLYRATFEHPDYFPLEAEIEIVEGEPLLGLDVNFEPGIRVRGTLIGLSGEDPCTAAVEWRSVADPDYVRRVTTEEDGEYQVGGLVPGDYEVIVTPEKLAAAWSRSAATLEVTLGEEKEQTLDLEAEMGAGLRIEVFARGGAPIAGVQVQYTVSRGERGMSGFLPATGDDGSTLVCGLPAAGRLVLEVPPREEGTARQALDLSQLPPEVRLVLGTAPVVEGLAIDDEGKPLAGVRVAAARRGGGIEETTETDATGTFSIPGLEPGVWELRASMASPPLGATKEVTVRPNSSLRSLRVVLTPGAAISGIVVDSEGAPVPGARVGIRGQDFLDETRSSESGSFVFAVRQGKAYEITATAREQGLPSLTRGIGPGRNVRLVLPARP